ncbi:MAG: FliM/FliN family flagellar motor C-terminal domain-containing protein [Pseudomonadota bacterium]
MTSPEMTSDTASGEMKPDMKSPFSAVPIEITISVGRARPLIRDLLALKKHSVLPLDRRVDDAVELYVGERLIARGQLEELEGDAQGQLAVRLTEVAQMQDGLE